MRFPNKKCPVCDSSSISIFLDIREVPVHCNVLWKRREDAKKAKRGCLRLGLCQDCGHVFNTAFEPKAVKYSEEYENSLHFSPFFQDYAQNLAARLIERHNLREKDIIEIGCGKGEFLMLLSEMGGNRGVGFDASYAEERLCANTENVTFIKDLYSERYSEYRGDLILSRQVLEHLEDPRSFVEDLRTSIGSETGVVFFEVPNFLHTIKELAIWDIIYEHYSYFTPNSFKRLFNNGFRVERIEESFEGQFLCLEASSAAASRKRAYRARLALDGLKKDVAAFTLKYHEKVTAWKAELQRMSAAGQKAVVWGGGSKGVTFLNTFSPASQITHVIDINPHKHGKFTPGTGHEIVGPEALKEINPDLILVMNPIYIGEIWEMLRSMEVKCRILTA